MRIVRIALFSIVVCAAFGCTSTLAALSGDANGDGKVDISDFVVLKNNFGMAEGATVSDGDFNDDGRVNISDFVILKNNFGRIEQTPQPPVQLDISDAFNVDAWCGPREMQAVFEYAAANEPDQDLKELQGLLDGAGVGWCILNSSHLMVGASTADGCGETYSIATQWFHPRYVSAVEGTPEDGVLTGADGREYHIASVLGNATLPGDWLEAAEPGEVWETKPNAVVVGAVYNRADWQIPSMTIELPAHQKSCYVGVNFVLAAMDMTDRARNIRIVALYGESGADPEVIYAFSTADGGSGPMMKELDGGTDFRVLHSMSKFYNSSAGATGDLGSQNSCLYEFATPLALNNRKMLWGFRVEDVDPSLNYNGRGLAIVAATANSDPIVAINKSPVADAGSDQIVVDTGDDGAESVTLDGSGSSDPDGTIAGYSWIESDFQIAAGVSPVVSLPLGRHTIELTVIDDGGATDADTVIVTVNADIPSGAAVYYVDYDSGSDSNAGVSPTAAWKHCPGDVNATANAASTVLTGGDTVVFKGGVIYRGEIVCNRSGADGEPIIYDGDTAGSWGAGRAIIDGSQEITGWTPCANAAEADGNPNWAHIYWTYAPAGTTAFNTDLFEGETRLYPAQDPNLSDPFHYDNIADWETFDSYADTTITDVDYFTQTDPTYWDGATCIYIHAGNNHAIRKGVTGYDPAANTIQFESLGTTAYTSFAMVNSLKILDVPGEMVVREDQTDAGGRPRVYIWPTAGPVNGEAFTVAVEKGAFNLTDESHITIRGFVLTKSAAYRGAVYNNFNADATDITVDDNIIVHHADCGVYLDDVDNCTASNNEVRYCRDRGIQLTDANNAAVRGNEIRNVGTTAVILMGCSGAEIRSNIVADNLGVHANGISCYEYCSDVMIFGNQVTGGRVACTLGDGSNVTVAYNILDGNGGDYAFADWRNQNGLYIYNNVIVNGGSTIASDSVNVVVRNNIMGRSSIAYRGGLCEYNIYTELDWTQDPDNLGLGEFQASSSQLWVDPDGGDYRLREGSPAVDAGVDVGLGADMDGNAVPCGAAPDIGAYEF